MNEVKAALLTIVIANYNYGRFLKYAIESILRETDCVDGKRLIIGGAAIELVICDAGSSDNSLGIIKEYADRIFWWCSEPDGGQSAAFNKGFSHGTGKYLTWLNADDMYVYGGLKATVKAMLAHPECDWFTGNTVGFLDGGPIIHAAVGPHWFPYWLQFRISPIVMPGPTSFFSRKIYEEVGRIEEYLHYTMDTVLWIKFIIRGFKQRRILPLVWAFRYHDASKTCEFEGHKLDDGKKQRMRAEFERATKGMGYIPSKAIHIIYLFFRLLDGSLIRRYYYWHFKKYIKGINR